MTIEIKIEYIRLALILLFAIGMVASALLTQRSLDDRESLSIVVLPVAVGITFGLMMLLINL